MLGGFGGVEEGEEAGEAVHFFAVANVANDGEGLGSFGGFFFVEIPEASGGSAGRNIEVR